MEKVLTNADSLFSGFNIVLNSEGKNNISKTLEKLSSALKNTDDLVSRFNSITKNQSENIAKIILNLTTVSENLGQISDSLSKSNLKQTINNFENYPQILIRSLLKLKMAKAL